MKALVTGAAGFIGSHVVRQLIDTGVQVRALHLPGENLRNLKDLDVELIEGDITDAAVMARATRDVKYVFHMAALSTLDLVKMVHRILGVGRPIAKVSFIAGEIVARTALWATENVTHTAPSITPTSIHIARLGLAADYSKALRELGLPQTPIETAVRDALRWFGERGYLKGARV